MSLYENFKANDHSAEKKILSIILLIALFVASLFLFAELSKCIPKNVSRFICMYDSGMLKFLGLLIAVPMLTFLFFLGFDADYEESKNEKLLVTISKGAWILLFVSWSIYCAWMTYDFKPLTANISMLILGLVIIPGFVLFLFFRNMRKKDIQREERISEFMEHNTGNQLTSKDDLHWKNYPGYYGLVCFPVYLLALLIGLFIR